MHKRYQGQGNNFYNRLERRHPSCRSQAIQQYGQTRNVLVAEHINKGENAGHTVRRESLYRLICRSIAGALSRRLLTFCKPAAIINLSIGFVQIAQDSVDIEAELLF